MKDLVGKDLKVGDEVILNSKAGSSFGTNTLHIGEIVGFTKTKVKVKSSVRCTETVLKDPSQVYKIS